MNAAGARERPPARVEALDDSGVSHLVGYLLALATAQTRQVFQRKIGAPFDLRPIEFTLLVLLQANPGAAPKQLGRTLEMTAPNLSVLLDRMEARGLVERRRSHTDGRALRLHLTSAGEDFARRAHEASLTMEEPLQQALSPGERLVLRELLLKFARGAAT